MTQAAPVLDLSEKGRGGISLDRRLYMQFQAFGNCVDTEPVFAALAESLGLGGSADRLLQALAAAAGRNT